MSETVIQRTKQNWHLRILLLLWIHSASLSFSHIKKEKIVYLFHCFECWLLHMGFSLVVALGLGCPTAHGISGPWLGMEPCVPCTGRRVLNPGLPWKSGKVKRIHHMSHLLTGMHLGWVTHVPPGKTLSQNDWPETTLHHKTQNCEPCGRFPYAHALCQGTSSQ